MRVVLDTNVLVSGIGFVGPPGEIIALASTRQLQLILSSSVDYHAPTGAMREVRVR